MRAIRVASAALLGMTALALCAPAARASGGETDEGDGDHHVMSEGYSLLPATVAAGGRVTLLADRRTSGCKGSVTVSSEAFEPVRIAWGAESATAVVDPAAKPGAVHRVTFTCGALSAVKELTVAGGGHGDPAAELYPVPHGVRAGEGGSAGGLDLQEIGLGAALIAGSLGTAYRLSRRGAATDAV